MSRLPLGRPQVHRRQLVVVLLLVCSVVLAAEKKARPLDRDDVAQVWLGWSDSAVFVYRLDLRSDGTGLGAYIFSEEAPQLFRITSWTYKAGNIDMIAIPPAGQPRGVERLRGVIRGVEMKLTMSGPDWREELILRRERDHQPRWDQMKDAMRHVLANPE